ncbi:MAG: hypothetical protein AB1510_10775 [Bacillota bacterium]
MPSRLNIDLRDEGLYKAVKIQAVEEGTTVRDIVTEALRQWLRQKGNKAKGIDRAALTRMNEARKRVFGSRVLPGSSTDLIREARKERLSRL